MKQRPRNRVEQLPQVTCRHRLQLDDAPPPTSRNPAKLSPATSSTPVILMAALFAAGGSSACPPRVILSEVPTLCFYLPAPRGQVGTQPKNPSSPSSLSRRHFPSPAPEARHKLAHRGNGGKNAPSKNEQKTPEGVTQSFSCAPLCLPRRSMYAVILMAAPLAAGESSGSPAAQSRPPRQHRRGTIPKR